MAGIVCFAVALMSSLNPRGSLQRPHAIGIFLLKLARQLTEDGVIIRQFVMADAFPVKGFRRGFTVWIMIEHRSVSAFRLSPVLTHERNAREAHLQLRAKLVRRQITLDAMAFLSVLIEYEDSRCPHSVEAMEIRGMFFDVS